MAGENAIGPGARWNLWGVGDYAGECAAAGVAAPKLPGCIRRAHYSSNVSPCPPAAAKGQAALPALAPPVPPALAAPSASACGHASSSSSQEAASHPDVEDTGRAPVQVPGSSASAGGSDGAAATRASLILAPPPAVISLKSEPLQLAPQQPHAEQSPPPSSCGGDGELRVVIDSKERLRWSPALHQRFCQAVDSLGGCAVAKVGRAGASAGKRSGEYARFSDESARLMVRKPLLQNSVLLLRAPGLRVAGSLCPSCSAAQGHCAAHGRARTHAGACEKVWNEAEAAMTVCGSVQAGRHQDMLS